MLIISQNKCLLHWSSSASLDYPLFLSYWNMSIKYDHQSVYLFVSQSSLYSVCCMCSHWSQASTISSYHMNDRKKRKKKLRLKWHKICCINIVSELNYGTIIFIIEQFQDITALLVILVIFRFCFTVMLHWNNLYGRNCYK